MIPSLIHSPVTNKKKPFICSKKFLFLSHATMLHACVPLFEKLTYNELIIKEAKDSEWINNCKI